MSRGFTALKKGVKLPQRSTKYSAGYDFFVPGKVIIPAGEKKIVRTFVAAYMNEDEYLSIHVRSSLAIKRGLALVNQVGIIDSDYYNNPDNGGEILIALQNTTSEDVVLDVGEKFVQGIFHRYLTIDGDDQEEVRLGGIGSTH